MDTSQNRSSNEPQKDEHSELHLPPVANTGSHHLLPPDTQTPPRIPQGNTTPPSLEQHTVFSLRDDDDKDRPDDDSDAFDPVLAPPFQLSEAIPSIQSQTAARQPTRSASFNHPLPSHKRSRIPLLRAVLLLSVLITALLAGVIVVLAQSTSTHLSSRTIPLSPPPPARKQRAMRPVSQPTQKPAQPTPPPMQPGNVMTAGTGAGMSWVPQSFPEGWTQAGLTTGDALFAERTAVSFTDREMSIDFRSIGTRATHGGTMTAATVLLTPAAQQRFAQNDVRVINNVLFDKVIQEQLVQSVMAPEPGLMNFAAQNNQLFAWIDVSFLLWQAKTDLNGQHQEGIEVNPALKLPGLHHMAVLLVRAPQSTAMGGTGWLVSTYALDTSTPPDIILPA